VAAGAGNLLHVCRAIDETVIAKAMIAKTTLIYEKHDFDYESRRFHKRHRTIAVQDTDEGHRISLQVAEESRDTGLPGDRSRPRACSFTDTFR
jgi:hypothetical protein